MMDIMNLNMLPYGAASGSGTAIQCQHGEQECLLNKISACAFKHISSPKDVLPFSLCLDTQSAAPPPADSLIAKCAPASAQDAIKKCIASAEVTSSMTDIASKTGALKTEYSPWVVVNGQHMDWHYSLLATVCKAYTGPNRPAVCSRPSAAFVATARNNTYADLLCYPPGKSPSITLPYEAL